MTVIIGYVWVTVAWVGLAYCAWSLVRSGSTADKAERRTFREYRNGRLR